MGTLVKYCETCNKQFMPYRPFQKYHSDKCRLIAHEKEYRYVRKPDVTRQCRQCGTEFVTNNKKKVFHNTKCQKEYQIENRNNLEPDERTCAYCGDKFETTHHAKKYCHTDCYDEAKKEREKK
jgi:hypothetical protein